MADSSRRRRSLSEVFKAWLGYPPEPPPPPADPKPWDGYHRVVELPEGTTHIPPGAFYDRSCLEHITFPNSLVSVGARGFMNCHGLQQVALPDYCSVGKSCFHNCSRLKSITLPVGLKSVKRGTFAGCGRLESIRFPAGLESIEHSAFIWCVSAPQHTLNRPHEAHTHTQPPA